MKKFISIVFLFITVNSIAQYSSIANQDNANQHYFPVAPGKFKTPIQHTIYSGNLNKDAEYYTKKSKNQKIVGWCFVGGGAIGLAIGLASFPKGADLLFTSEEDQSKVDLATTITIIGSALMIGSIPFFVLSNVNKRKARLYIKNEKTTLGCIYPKGSYATGITLNIALGK